MGYGVESKQILLPVGAVVLPAACFLKAGQRITLSNFSRIESTELPNKALHRTAIPLRSIAAGELGRSAARNLKKRK